MKTSLVLLGMAVFCGILFACNKDRLEPASYLDELGNTKYFDAEIFAPSDTKIYGLWQVFDISGGIHGEG